jgi:XTP/dITP diphosphohydrolase
VILVAATGNAGKLRELRTLLDDPADRAADAGGLAGLRPAPEDGDTFLANARIKAHAVAGGRGCRLSPTTRDSPSTRSAACRACRSARFAEDAAAGRGDAANVALLLERLRDVPPSGARRAFTAPWSCARPDGRELVTEGTCEGIIAAAPRGRGGFGYDPVFLYGDRTFAEIDAEEKDRVSHRARAIAALRPRLGAFLGAP